MRVRHARCLFFLSVFPKFGRNASLAILGGMALLAIACGGAAQAAASDTAPTAAKQAWGGKGLTKGARQARIVSSPKETANGCPAEMVSIDGRFCVDRYEGSLVEVLPNGEEQSWSPYKMVNGHNVRAVSQPHVVPQAYISAIQAGQACAHSKKRLCKPAEWKKACMGPEKLTYGYSNTDQPRRCNDHGANPLTATFGLNNTGKVHGWEAMNFPMLNQVENTIAKSGEHPGCTNGYGVYDMVGNVHEWVADPKGTFQGGYYQDTHQLGDGCKYATLAHSASYHDYSTGFRCCADPSR